MTTRLSPTSAVEVSKYYKVRNVRYISADVNMVRTVCNVHSQQLVIESLSESSSTNSPISTRRLPLARATDTVRSKGPQRRRTQRTYRTKPLLASARPPSTLDLDGLIYRKRWISACALLKSIPDQCI